MAITVANKTSGLDDTDITGSYTTASVAFVANRLYLLSVVTHGSSGTLHTATGTDTTWTSIATVRWSTIAAGNKRLTVFRCMPGTSPTETVSIGQGAGTKNHARWSIDEANGVDTSGTNGSGAIVQSNTNAADSGTTLSVSLGAFGDAGNAAFGAFSHSANEATTIGASFTELADITGTESPTTSFQTEYRIADDDPNVSWTTTSANAGIAMEIKIAGGGGAPTVARRMLLGVGV